MTEQMGRRAHIGRCDVHTDASECRWASVPRAANNVRIAAESAYRTRISTARDGAVAAKYP